MRRARPRLVAACACAALLAHASLVLAEQRAPTFPARASREIVLVAPPPRLERALHTALSPWGVRVSGVSRERPGATVPGTALQADALARELGAQTLVWVSSNESGAALWMYEVATGTLRARPCPDKPLDDVLAAALALTVKTWLRSADDEAEPLAEPAPAEPVEDTPLAPRARAEAPIVSDSGSAEVPEPARLRVLLHAAARGGAVDPMPLQARYGAELRGSPWRSPSGTTELWLGARFDASSAPQITTPSFQGTFDDAGGSVSAGLVQRLDSGFELGLHAGAALDRTTLSGTLLPDGSRVETARWVGSVLLRPEVGIALGPVGVLLQGGLGAPLRKQDYLVNGVKRVETEPLWWTVGGALRVDLL